MTCRRSQVRVLYRPPQKSSDFRLRIFCLVAVQDSNRAALTTPVGRVSNQPSGLLLSPRFPTPRNVYRDDCRFVVDGTELEQQRRRPPPAAETGSRGWDSVLIFQSPAKGLRKNQQTQPVQAPAVRFRQGSQRLGMSTKKDVARPFGLGMWWAVQNSNSNKQRQGITVAVCPAFCFASPYIVRFGSIAAYVRTWSVRTYAGKRASSDI